MRRCSKHHAQRKINPTQGPTGAVLLNQTLLAPIALSTPHVTDLFCNAATPVRVYIQ
jgi:hypothetical protein